MLFRSTSPRKGCIPAGYWPGLVGVTVDAMGATSVGSGRIGAVAERDDEQRPGRPLLALAERYGVVTDHWDYHGARQVASDATLIAVLASLGVDASTPERVDLALANADDDPWRHMLPPIMVLRAGTSSQVPVHVEHGQPVDV